MHADLSPHTIQLDAYLPVIRYTTPLLRNAADAVRHTIRQQSQQNDHDLFTRLNAARQRVLAHY